MRIIVPSLGRAGNCNSMKWLLRAERRIQFAVHLDEASDYEKAYPDHTCLILSDECRKHTGLVRKEIIDHLGDEPFFFVDDDIRISLKTTTSIKEVFDSLEKHIYAGASMAGLGQQLFSNAKDTYTVNHELYTGIRNQFVATVYAINPAHFKDCPLEELPVYEDIALVIHAIQHGGGTVVSYMATHSNVSPPSGGCNSWRDPAITIASLNKLVELYPDICSIRETSNTTHSQNIGIGLRTAWSKIRKLS